MKGDIEGKLRQMMKKIKEEEKENNGIPRTNNDAEGTRGEA